jgi:hypothetical protein
LLKSERDRDIRPGHCPSHDGALRPSKSLKRARRFGGTGHERFLCDRGVDAWPEGKPGFALVSPHSTNLLLELGRRRLHEAGVGARPSSRSGSFVSARHFVRSVGWVAFVLLVGSVLDLPRIFGSPTTLPVSKRATTGDIASCDYLRQLW